MPQDDLAKKAQLSLERLLPRLESTLSAMEDRELFLKRLQQNFPSVFRHLYDLYGGQYDFFYHLEQILINLATLFAARPDDLKALDITREADPAWFQSEKMIGGVCYVDLFAGDLKGLRKHILYFRELGL